MSESQLQDTLGHLLSTNLKVFEKLENIMDALADLKKAVSDLSTSVSNEIAAATAAIQASQSTNNGAVAEADAETIVTGLNNLKATLDAETAVLTAPVEPSIPVTPEVPPVA